MSQEFNTYFKEKEYDLLDFPRTVLIDTVSCCNLKCSMCVHKDMKRKKGFMDCFVVSDTGDIANCACDLDVSHSFGNLYEKSIKEIWNTTMKDFRIAHLERRWNDTSELCKGCRDWQSSGEVHYSPKRTLLDKIKKLLKLNSIESFGEKCNAFF